MATPDYSQLDAEILAEIGKGKVHFTQLASLRRFAPIRKMSHFVSLTAGSRRYAKRGKSVTTQNWVGGYVARMVPISAVVE